MRIACPFCGPRPLQEFSYRGDAGPVRPATSAPTEAWVAYTYLRDNPKGPHWELWQHLGGCRAWLKVERNTATHQITATVLARGIG